VVGLFQPFSFFQVDGGVVEVIFGVFKDELAVLWAQRPANFARHSSHQRVGRDHSVLGQDSAGGDDGAFADAAVVEDGRAHADQAGVLDDAAVDGGVVADGDPVADQDGVDVAHAVEDGAVLDVGVGADADFVDIAADDGVHPDGGVLAEDDVADDLGGEVDVAGSGDGGEDSLVGTDHFCSFYALAAGRVCRILQGLAGDGMQVFAYKTNKIV